MRSLPYIYRHKEANKNIFERAKENYSKANSCKENPQKRESETNASENLNTRMY